MRAQTIDDVINILDTIVATCVDENSRAGFFAALYRMVTVKVKDAVNAGEFEDGDRLEQLDVNFANRYFDAFFARQQNKPLTLAWDYTFRLAPKPHPLILQHLLLGTNAHINLDLAVAAADVAPGNAIHGLQRDFDHINTILATQIDTVQNSIAAVSPLFGLIDRVGGDLDEAVTRFSIDKARNAAWEKALILAGLDAAERQRTIAFFDLRVRLLARALCPSYIVSSLHRQVRSAEMDDVPAVIEWLGR